MKAPKVVICTIARGGWYHRGVARLITELARYQMHEITVQAWVNTLPEGAEIMIEDSYDYTAYGAKPHALWAARGIGADIAILLDASYYPVRHFGPLVGHIADHGYYLQTNGFSVGQWASDRALWSMDLPRDLTLHIPDVASGCVGIDFRSLPGRDLACRWLELSVSETICGPHSNSAAGPEARRLAESGGYRNVGFCSHDPRVAGHRHDQTSLSVAAYQTSANVRVDRPRFCSYADHVANETVFVCKGGI
jgi:hypothetical protein